MHRMLRLHLPPSDCKDWNERKNRSEMSHQNHHTRAKRFDRLMQDDANVFLVIATHLALCTRAGDLGDL